MIDHHTKIRRRWVAQLQANQQRLADYRDRRKARQSVIDGWLATDRRMSVVEFIIKRRLRQRKAGDGDIGLYPLGYPSNDRKRP